MSSDVRTDGRKRRDEAGAVGAKQNAWVDAPRDTINPGVDFSKVCADEDAFIRARREKAFCCKQPSTKVTDLVGLAQSGGGLRSATFNLGLLQALRERGLLRYVDYISSVSGGGYTSGYLARAAHDSPDFHNTAVVTDPAYWGESGWITSNDHLRFRNCGSYLRRPLEFLGEYLVCTFLVLALFAAALASLALAVVIFWRTFDLPVVRDRLQIIDLNVELLTAFLPCLVLFLAWVSLDLGDRVDAAWRVVALRICKHRKRLRPWIDIAAGVAAVALALDIALFASIPFVVVPFAFTAAMCIASFGLTRLVRCIRYLMPETTRSHAWQNQWGAYIDPLMIALACAASALPFILSTTPAIEFPGWLPVPLAEWLRSWLPDGWPIMFDEAVGSYVIDDAAFAEFVFGFALTCLFASWASLGTVRMKRIMLFAFLVSPFAALMILVANGSLSLGWLARVFGVDSELSSQQVLREPLLAFVALCILALFRYRRLLRSARPQAAFWERVIFGTVITGICLGVPLVLIGWFGREGLSGYAVYRDPYLHRSDILNWQAFLDLYDEGGLGNTLRVPPTLRSALSAMRDKDNHLLGEPSWDRNSHTFVNPQRGWLARGGMLIDSLRLPVPGATASKDNGVPGFLAAANAARSEIQKFVEGDECEDWLASQALATSLAQEMRQRALENLSHSSGDNELVACQKFIDGLADGMDEGARLKHYYERATDHLSSAHNRELAFSLDHDYFWDKYNKASFNRLLLEALYPRVFKSRTMVSTPVVVEQDQVTRVGYLAIASLVFLALFATLPVNRLSAFHRFYRRKLNAEFLSPDPGSGRKESPMPLHQLAPHVKGGPYPLYMATLYFTREQSSAEFNSSRRALQSRHVPLLFSPAYCGTREFGYQATNKDPWKDFALEDAVAVSGSALNPLALGQGGIYWILSAFNLRTGQWISRPGKSGLLPRPLSYIKPVHIYREWYDTEVSAESFWSDGAENVSDGADSDWRVGSAGDGGFHDFLGIQPLLERKCRLVIVSDAGCNQNEEEFQSLADVIRNLRIEQGVELLDWDDDRPLDIARLTREKDSRLSPQHFIMGRIVYRGAPEGVLVYIQMTMTGDEGAELVQYHRAHDTFPNEPTTNQFFSPTEVEAFRTLGYHTAKTLCAELDKVPAPTAAHPSLAEKIEIVIQRLSDAYSVTSGMEDKVDENDFNSRLPFVPDLPASQASRFRALFPITADPRIRQAVDTERDAVRKYESSSDHRRAVWSEIHDVIEGLDNGRYS